MTARKSGIKKGIKELQNGELSFTWTGKNIHQQ